jgi:hypothetical protein
MLETWLPHVSPAGEVSFDNVSESNDSIRIELDPGPAIQLLKRFPKGTSSPVRAIASNGVKGICDR